MENIDKESRFAHLLKPIRELADNWDIDIANDLENYLEELESVSINLGDGYRNLNFAEAALLIQGSALVYSKKVEYLYTLVFETLEMLSRDNKSKQEIKQRKQADNDDDEMLFNTDEPFLVLDCSQIEEGKDIDMAQNESIKTKLYKRLSIPGRSSLLLKPLPLQLISNPNERSLSLSNCAVTSSGAFLMNKSVNLPIQDTTFNQSFSLNQISVNPQNPRHSIGVALQAESDSLAISGVQNSDLSEDSLLHQEIGSPQKDAEPLDVQGGADFSLPSTPRDENEILQNTLMTPQKTDRRPHREEEVKSKKNDVFEPLDPHQYYNRGNTPFKKGVPYVLPNSKSNKMSIDCSDYRFSQFPWEESFSSSSNVLFPEFIPLYNEVHTSLKTYKGYLTRMAYLNDIQNKSILNDSENEDDLDALQEQENDNVEEEGHNLSIIENEIGDMGDLVENDFGMELNVPLEMNNTETNQLQAEENNRGDENPVEYVSQDTQSFQSYEDLCRFYINRFMEGSAQYARETDLLRRVRMWEDKVEVMLNTQSKYPAFDIRYTGKEILNEIEEHNQLQDLVKSNQNTIKEKNEQNDSDEHPQIRFYDLNKNATDYEIRRNFVALLQLANEKSINITSTKMKDGCDDIIIQLTNPNSLDESM